MAAAKVQRLPGRRGDAIVEALQLALDLPLGLAPDTRSDLALALERRAIGERETWFFVMLNPEQQRAVIKAIRRGPKPALTMSVWNAAISAVRYDTGDIAASVATLASYADTTPAEASRALSQLADIGAVRRIGRGRYAINPNVAWSGNLAKREAAAHHVLRLVPAG